MTENESIKINETKSDNVTLKRNAKGDMAWDIKLYFNVENGTEEVLAQIDDINKSLTETYA